MKAFSKVGKVNIHILTFRAVCVKFQGYNEDQVFLHKDASFVIAKGATQQTLEKTKGSN